MPSETYRKLYGVMSAVDVDRPEWAQQFAVGDEVAIECPPDGEVRTFEIVGFSSRDEHEGRPVILADADLRQWFEDDVQQVALRADDLAEPQEAAIQHE